MELKSCLGIYTDTDKTVSQLALKPAQMLSVLAHTAINAAILNLGIATVFVEIPEMAVFYFVSLGTLTFLSIIAIEAATFYLGVKTGIKDGMWKQLKITNAYITPIFVVFFIFWVLSAFLPDWFKIGLDMLAFPIVLFMNDKKIKGLYGASDIGKARLVYGAGTVIAYLCWLFLLFAPAIIFALLE